MEARKLIFFSTAAALVWLASVAGVEADDEQAGWDYEPRVWQPDESTFDDGAFELRQPSGSAEKVWTGAGEEEENDEDARRLGEESSLREIRLESNFWPRQSKQANGDGKESRERLEREFERKSSTPGRRTVRQSGAEDKCTQFRVDIHETVICEKGRCEKLDFEWPKHDNQIVHIQTTRHGMRFYRAEYAFAGTARGLRGRARESTRAGQQGASGARTREQVVTREQARLKPVKFDLFELFKPKTTTTTTTTTASSTSASSSAPSAEPAAATTAATAAPGPEPEATTSGQSGTARDQPATVTSSSAGSRAKLNSSRLVTSFRVSTRHRRQTMLGFGGALSDASCRNIRSLSAEMAKSLMEDYFGERGLRFNIVRMSMGSSDFSTTPYTNNDAGPATRLLDDGAAELDDHENRDDVEMRRFRLVDEDFEFKLPVARQAIATSRQPIKFFSSLWSPPIWMKNNSNIVHGWLKGDVYGPYYKALADYMIRWLEAYRKQGVEFWATSGLNEPVTGIKPFIFHNSLGITRDDYVTFIKLYLGPMLRQRGFSSTKLIVLDDNKGYAPRWARAVLQDPEAAQYVAGVGVHWYMNDEYENLDFLAREFPRKFLLSTEACNGYLPFQVHTLPGNWERGVAYLYDMLKVIQRNSAGWVDWNMALDLGGGPSWAKNNLDAPVIVNSHRDEYYKSPTFYAIGHLSKFVEPNSSRLDHRLANARYDRPLESVAFLTPRGHVVIVALNANRHPVPFRIIVDAQLVRVVTLRAESFNTIIFKWPTQVGS